MALTDAAMLDLVDDAITNLLGGGQSYSRAGFTFTRADLTRLWDMHKELSGNVAAGGTNGIAFVSDRSGATSSGEW